MTLTTVTQEIDRDRYGRPLIRPAAGGKPVPYTRVTTLAGAIDDLNGLIKWKIGRAITGIVDRPDLLLSAAAHRDDKQKLYTICDEALEAGGASAAATVGTAVHAFAEQLDRGQILGAIPEPYKADVDAYATATRNLTPLHVEELIVIDDLQTAGTPDRIVTFEGENYIADLKTGGIDFPHKMAAQLALYAHGRLYNHATGQRTPLPAVNGERGIIIHLPAGTGRCTLHWINIAAGWEAVQLAVAVRGWRKRQGLIEPFTDPRPEITALQDAGLIVDPITAQLEAAPTVDALLAIWEANKTTWQPEHTTAASARKQALTQT